MTKAREQTLRQINQILEKAFFAPLQATDWLGFHFNQPFLLGLNQDELSDIFARCVLAEQRLRSRSKIKPLAALLSSQAPAQVLAHALGSLKDDRPFLFHRSLTSLASRWSGQLNPDDHNSLEAMLEQALQSRLELAAGAEQEIEGLCRQAMDLIQPQPAAKIKKYVKQLLQSEQLFDIKNENQLRLWLSAGSGGQRVEETCLPQVLIETWAAWCGAITGARPNAELLLRCQPDLALPSEFLENYLPLQADSQTSLSADCPFCQAHNLIKVGQDKIEASQRCPHLIFIGTNDPMHLLRALLLVPASIGEDILQLLDSYYQSAGDQSLFANIVSDLYQMLVNRGRLEEAPVSGQPHGSALASLRAYFVQPLELKKDS